MHRHYSSIFIDIGFLISFLGLYWIINLINYDTRWYFFLITWMTGGLLYSTSYKVILGKTLGYWSGQGKILFLSLFSLVLWFLVFIIKTKALKHGDWESLIFFKRYAFALIIITFSSFSFGFVISKIFLKEKPVKFEETDSRSKNI